MSQPEMGKAAIELEGVGVNFNGALILEDVNLTIEAGRYVGILGPNGAGKSTLLKVILGLIRPQRGTVRVFGESPEKLRHHGNVVGYLPQRPLGNPRFPVTVLDVVLMGRYGRIGLFKRPRREDRDLARRRLEDLGISHLADRLIGDLSGGSSSGSSLPGPWALNPGSWCWTNPRCPWMPASRTTSSSWSTPSERS